MSNLNEAEDYKILSFETDAKIPEVTNESDIIKFNDNNKIVEKSKTNPYHFFKRGLDVAIASVALVVLSPVFLATSIAIKLDSKGPVIFKQKRTGKDGKEFNLYKFRSMVADNDVHDFKCQDKHTKVGNFIRKTSLDELPQLVNILKGDMAFIGPRPWIPDYYENMNEEQRHRCDVLPGITGLAQASGRNNISIFDKINYDLEYVENYSLKEDINVVFKTVKTVLSKEGADAGKNTIQNELEDLKNQFKYIEVENNNIENIGDVNNYIKV